MVAQGIVLGVGWRLREHGVVGGDERGRIIGVVGGAPLFDVEARDGVVSVAAGAASTEPCRAHVGHLAWREGCQVLAHPVCNFRIDWKRTKEVERDGLGRLDSLSIWAVLGEEIRVAKI